PRLVCGPARRDWVFDSRLRAQPVRRHVAGGPDHELVPPVLQWVRGRGVLRRRRRRWRRRIVVTDGGPAPSLPIMPEGLEFIRALGQGRMSWVYLARESGLERLVVVKALRPELSADGTARLRFEREARSAASLMHPNVVPVYRFGQLPDGTPYLVMAYVKGRTLADLIQAEGTLGERE